MLSGEAGEYVVSIPKQIRSGEENNEAKRPQLEQRAGVLLTLRMKLEVEESRDGSKGELFGHGSFAGALSLLLAGTSNNFNAGGRCRDQERGKALLQLLIGQRQSVRPWVCDWPVHWQTFERCHANCSVEASCQQLNNVDDADTPVAILHAARLLSLGLGRIRRQPFRAPGRPSRTQRLTTSYPTSCRAARAVIMAAMSASLLPRLTSTTTILSSSRLATLYTRNFTHQFLPALPIALPGVSLNIPTLLGDIWESILRAVPKKKTSHSKKRHRQMAGKALQDVNHLCKCPGCGAVKRTHRLCSNCLEGMHHATIAEVWDGI